MPDQKQDSPKAANRDKTALRTKFCGVAFQAPSLPRGASPRHHPPPAKEGPASRTLPLAPAERNHSPTNIPRRRPPAPYARKAWGNFWRNRTICAIVFGRIAPPLPSDFPHWLPYLVLKTWIIHNTFHSAVENIGRKSERGDLPPNPKRARRRGFPRGAPAGHGKRKDLSRRVAAWQSATAAEEAYCGQRTAKRGKDRSSARYCSTQRAKAQAVDFLTLRRSGGVRPAGRGCRPGPARRGPAAF